MHSTFFMFNTICHFSNSIFICLFFSIFRKRCLVFETCFLIFRQHSSSVLTSEEIHIYYNDKTVVLLYLFFHLLDILDFEQFKAKPEIHPPKSTCMIYDRIVDYNKNNNSRIIDTKSKLKQT